MRGLYEGPARCVVTVESSNQAALFAQTELARFLRSSALGWTSQGGPQNASRSSVVIQKPDSPLLRLVFRI